MNNSPNDKTVSQNETKRKVLAMNAQHINTNPLAKVNWRAWDELEKLTGQTKRLTMRILVLDQDSLELPKLREQYKKAFLRMDDLLVILSRQL